MKTYRKIVETTIIDEHNHEEKHIKETLHKVRHWSELTREEQEKAIEEHHESIYECYQNDLYENFKFDLEDLKYTNPSIYFEDIFIDSNSQGWWIDRVTHFQYTGTIEIYGETIEIEDIDLHIRKYIDKDFELYINKWSIQDNLLDKILASKKYKDWIKKVRQDIENWINRANEICEDLCSKEYYYPYNLDDNEDKEYLDFYFEDMEFEEEETINVEDYIE